MLPGTRKPPIGAGDDENGEAGRAVAGDALGLGDEGMLGRGGGATGLNAGAGVLAGAIGGALTGAFAAGAFFATLRFADDLRADAFFAVRLLTADFAVFFFFRAATAFFTVFLVFLAFFDFAFFAMIILPIVRGESSIAQ